MSVRIGKVIHAIMRDIAQARMRADYFSKKAAERYLVDMPGFTVPRVDISDINMDIKYIIDDVSEADNEDSEEVTVQVQSVLKKFMDEKLLPLWPVLYRISSQDRKEIESNLFEVLQNNYTISADVDRRSKSQLNLKNDINAAVNSFFSEITKKRYNPTSEQFVDNWSDRCMVLDGSDNICFADYGEDMENLATIKSSQGGDRIIAINELSEDSSTSNLTNKKEPLYIYKNGKGVNQKYAILLMYGNYKFQNTSWYKGPAICIFENNNFDSPFKTRIATAINGIDMTEKESVIALAVPDIGKKRVRLAFYSSISRKLIIAEYHDNVSSSLYDKVIPPNIHWMGFIKDGEYLALLVTTSTSSNTRYYLSFIPTSSIRNRTDLFNSQYLYRTGIKRNSHVVCAFSENDQGEQNLIYGCSNDLHMIKCKDIKASNINSPDTWIPSPTETRKPLPVGATHVMFLATSADSSYVAALCFPNRNGQANFDGIFYVFVYTGDLTEVARYKVSPPIAGNNQSSFKIFFLSTNDIVVLRNKEKYTFPSTFHPPTKENVKKSLDGFGDHKIDYAKLTNMLVKVEDEELNNAPDRVSSLSINFNVKNYKWQKAVQEDETAGLLIEEVND